MSMRSLLTVLFLTLSCFIIYFAHAQNNGFSVELIHRDSSKSPLYQPTLNNYQRVANALRRSINRVNHIYKDSLTNNTPESTVSSGDGDFLMTYSIGTPPFKIYGVVDTGSDIVWLQCKPCEKCYNQTTPIFDPSISSTYKNNILCLSNKCKFVGSTSCGENNSCEYTISYNDGSISQGDLSVETLTLDSTSGYSISFPNTPELSNSTSKLNFGEAVVVSGHEVMSTPMVIRDHAVSYFLTLEAFSIGNKRVEFIKDSNGVVDGNIVIDSGTTLTTQSIDCTKPY
ncbi:hypothetical protein P8452_74401 [Trifolium repens]|nr:hypothetical protein P8452_74401 [Trifolium repens]